MPSFRCLITVDHFTVAHFTDPTKNGCRIFRCRIFRLPSFPLPTLLLPSLPFTSVSAVWIALCYNKHDSFFSFVVQLLPCNTRSTSSTESFVSLWDVTDLRKDSPWVLQETVWHYSWAQIGVYQYVTIFVARCYASAACVIMWWLCVCLSHDAMPARPVPSCDDCVSVWFVNSVKMNKHIFKFF